MFWVYACNGETKSAYSNQATRKVVGAPFITITAPAKGELVPAGSVYHVRWYASYAVEAVVVKLTTDGGLSWETLTKQCGIQDGAPAAGQPRSSAA